MQQSELVLGVDTGGTFTDFVLFDGESMRMHKVLSTSSAPEEAILQGIREMGLEQRGGYRGCEWEFDAQHEVLSG